MPPNPSQHNINELLGLFFRDPVPAIPHILILNTLKKLPSHLLPIRLRGKTTIAPERQVRHLTLPLLLPPLYIHLRIPLKGPVHIQPTPDPTRRAVRNSINLQVRRRERSRVLAQTVKEVFLVDPDRGGCVDQRLGEIGDPDEMPELCRCFTVMVKLGPEGGELAGANRRG